MKYKCFAFILIVFLGMTACNYDQKIHVPSKQYDSFQLSAKQTKGQYLEVTIVNTYPNNIGFAYADRIPTSNNGEAHASELQFCFDDTLVIPILFQNSLVLYQFKKDSTGMKLEYSGTCCPDIFFEIY